MLQGHCGTTRLKEKIKGVRIIKKMVHSLAGIRSLSDIIYRDEHNAVLKLIVSLAKLL